MARKRESRLLGAGHPLAASGATNLGGFEISPISAPWLPPIATARRL
jgi:hypothetical protein